jgi:hypothetical protein
MTSSVTGRYRTARDVTIPKGTLVVYIHRMKKDVDRVANAFVRAGPEMYYELQMHWDDALRLGWIEKIEDG